MEATGNERWRMGTWLLLAVGLIIAGCREGAREREALGAVGAAGDVRECRELLRDEQAKLQSVEDESERRRLEGMFAARRTSLRRLADNPATRAGLADHCRELATQR